MHNNQYNPIILKDRKFSISTVLYNIEIIFENIIMVPIDLDNSILKVVASLVYISTAKGESGATASYSYNWYADVDIIKDPPTDISKLNPLVEIAIEEKLRQIKRNLESIEYTSLCIKGISIKDIENGKGKSYEISYKRPVSLRNLVPDMMHNATEPCESLMVVGNYVKNHITEDMTCKFDVIEGSKFIDIGLNLSKSILTEAALLETLFRILYKKMDRQEYDSVSELLHKSAVWSTVTLNNERKNTVMLMSMMLLNKEIREELDKFAVAIHRGILGDSL